jgi:hypothetical protein
MSNDSNLITEVEREAPMKHGTLSILYTKETRECVRQVRYVRDARGSQVLPLPCPSLACPA